MVNHQPVAVTGIGTVNGLGLDCRTFWQNLIAGQSAIAEIQSFDSSKWRTHVACEIKEPLPQQQYSDRVFNMVSIAANEAVKQAGITLPRNRTGVALGTLLGGIKTFEDDLNKRITEQKAFEINNHFPDFMMASLAKFLASEFGVTGPILTSNIACAASAAAISRAMDFIRLGKADVMIAGGADAFSQITFSGFNAMRSAASGKCQPFSKGREGLVIGEGSGILVLESLEHARARKADILALVLGSGLAEDAYHITSPEPEGRGAVRAMKAAMKDAGLKPEQIDYVNAHGTGTPQNDRMETKALKEVFGDYSRQLPVSSIKAAIGHCMGAAGGVEAVACILAITNEMMPPTINHESGDPDCDLDYIPNQPRVKKLNAVLSNSFGFAGNDACLIFGHPHSGRGAQYE